MAALEPPSAGLATAAPPCTLEVVPLSLNDQDLHQRQSDAHLAPLLVQAWLEVLPGKLTEKAAIARVPGLAAWSSTKRRQLVQATLAEAQEQRCKERPSFTAAQQRSPALLGVALPARAQLFAPIPVYPARLKLDFLLDELADHNNYTKFGRAVGARAQSLYDELPIHHGLDGFTGAEQRPNCAGYVRLLCNPVGELGIRVCQYFSGVAKMLLLHKKHLPPSAYAESYTLVQGCLLLNAAGEEVRRTAFMDGLLARVECGLRCHITHWQKYNTGVL